MSGKAVAPTSSELAIPSHVAIIMDGNGRWAKQRSLARIKGHEHGARAAREVVEEAGRQGVQYLTLYAFSVENWVRPEAEVRGLMELLVRFLKMNTSELIKKNVRLRAIGRLSDLPTGPAKTLQETIEATSGCDGLQLVLALSYGSRVEIVEAARQLATKVASGELMADAITEETFSQHLYTADIPDPDLLIRTSGEMRLSNFLLWQSSYAEIFVTQTLWPDFGRDTFQEALASYAGRKRRFGGV